jgi:serine protease Do
MLAPRIALALRRTRTIGFGAALALALGGAACGSAAAVPAAEPELARAAQQAVPVQIVRGPSLQLSADAAIPPASSIADLADRLRPTVVNITTVARAASGEPMHPFEFFLPLPERGQRPRPQRTGAGSGFIIDPAGYAVTNAHVVHGAAEVRVRLSDDRELEAEVAGRDEKLDLALLKIKGSETLPAATLGNSDVLRVGEHVVAVGNPFGLGHTVTMGIVSAKARTIGAGPYDDFIQTDASINPGNSGGPLFNLRGEVVGINTAIRAGADGIGFAIPVNVLRDVVAQLRDKGFVERGKLGLAFQPVTGELARALGLDRPRGALVSEVVPGSSAARAGIREGDVVVGVNDTEIGRAHELPINVARHGPGSAIQVHLLRDGKKVSVTATLDRLEDEQRERRAHRRPDAAGKTGKVLGVDVDDEPSGGVRVASVSRAQIDLEPGDVITEIDRKPVRNVAELREALGKTGTGATVLLKIKRDGRTRFVGVPLTD